MVLYLVIRHKIKVSNLLFPKIKMPLLKIYLKKKTTLNWMNHKVNWKKKITETIINPSKLKTSLKSKVSSSQEPKLFLD